MAISPTFEKAGSEAKGILSITCGKRANGQIIAAGLVKEPSPHVDP
jgi:hypothetical protein